MLSQEHRQIIENHQQEFPVFTLGIARDLGIGVYRSTNLGSNISGMIKRLDGNDNFTHAIYVNANHPETRRRFTIAHEISHFLLHRDLIGDGITDDVLYRSGFTANIETEANKLAADILMPWHLITEAMRQGINTIPDLANAFQVSNSAMSIRLGVPYET